MSTNTVSVPYGEVLRSMIDAAEAAAACGSRPRPFGFGRNAVPAPVREPAVLRRHPHLVRFADVEADLDLLIDLVRDRPEIAPATLRALHELDLVATRNGKI